MKSLALAAALMAPVLASAQGEKGATGVAFAIDTASGTYTITDAGTGFRVSGSVGAEVTLESASAGQSTVGDYRETRFRWTAQEGGQRTPVRGTIRAYDGKAVVLFRLEYLAARSGTGIAFPDFTSVPKGLRGFSHEDREFAPVRYRFFETSTPWTLFDDSARTMILSPASEFLVAKMVGDGTGTMGVALNARLKGVPKGLRQDSLLVFAPGINAAQAAWGSALRGLYGRTDEATKRDPLVRTFGYWTDNGATYYYNYDKAKGYAGTLLAVQERYKERRLPMGYLQLDSWWYRKLTTGFFDRASDTQKNRDFPAGDWNRFGGVLEYRADNDLFPQGLAAFQKRLGLPLVVHGRWIDRESPLRQKYKISGVTPIDPAYWEDTAEYLARSGVRVYEQDWMDHLYNDSPEMATTVGTADLFADGMARATAKRGLFLQYCMAQPRSMLNGVRYPNLTTVRASGDRFEPGKWAAFVMATPLVHAVGAVPWSDVFMSRETGNILLATLSAGPVGVGDPIGEEDEANIRRVARPDGRIVRPDAPLMPTDASYLDVGAPLVGATHTGEGATRTRYLFAFLREGSRSDTTLKLRSLGVTGRSYVLGTRTRKGEYVTPDDEFALSVRGGQYDYRIVAPVTRTGVAFLGDLAKFVPTGGERIAAMTDEADGLHVRVLFAPGEGAVTLGAMCPHRPRLRMVRGAVAPTGSGAGDYDAGSGRLTFAVTGSDGVAEFVLDGR